MGTKISFSYEHPFEKHSGIKRYKFEEPTYCVESPIDVLKVMIPKYHVIQYNSVRVNITSLMRFPVISSKPGIQYGSSIHVHGMNIEPYENNNGLTITGSISNFDTDFPQSDFSLTHSHDIVHRLIRKYLIDITILNRGHYVHGSRVFAMEVVPSKIIDYGRQKGISYLDIREKSPDAKKEQNLEDILDYGKVVLGQDFNEKSIREISSEIIKGIPKTFDPESGPYTFI